MATLSWNEIRQRALQFSREWISERRERAEAQTFWNEFFEVFGVRRRTVASFEEPVKSLKKTYDRIDLFWKRRLLAEHKSAGQSLDKAESQAFTYIQELAAENREDEIPRYIVLCNFTHFALYDLEPEHEDEPERIEFPLEDLHQHIKHFAFLIGQKTHRFGEEDPANLEAAQLMADLHDAMQEGGYAPHHLERLLVRVLFCLFAEDTGIFETGLFQLYLENHTRDDGVDLGQALVGLFYVLNTPEDKRQKHLEEDLAAFPYINGELFADPLPLAAFNRDMRNRLVAACRFDWSRISPAIFGSLFQGIMGAKERRQIGAHYTSERDIMKVIRPLFLDELREEFEHLKSLKAGRAQRLRAFQQNLASLKFLDPACGCGNFLVIAYRELRRLELELLQLLPEFQKDKDHLDYLGEEFKFSQVDVDQFYGIEIGEWPTRIAETALWLTDHQMNVELSRAFGNLFQRIPLKATPHIRWANALRFDWNDLLPAQQCSYVLGNPPFVGKRFQDKSQKADVRQVYGPAKGIGVVDYVTCWYLKASEYMAGSAIQAAFVSTNSICQGEQVEVFWSHWRRRCRMYINFAHRTFSWQSEARGAAHVHVVIIGFSTADKQHKYLFDYDDIRGEPNTTEVDRINPYLVCAADVLLPKRTTSLAQAPTLSFGSMPNDGRNLLLSAAERQSLIQSYPETASLIRPFWGSTEYIDGRCRYCLWLRGVSPSVLRSIPDITERLGRVRAVRESSSRPQTKRLAATPALFGEDRQPAGSYLAIPKTSSERRHYIPVGFLTAKDIASTELFTLPNATPYHFGVLTSAMHMAWVRQVCGRLKSDFRYSAKLVYNNFPWPQAPTEGQRVKVEECAQAVLDVRQKYLEQGSCLADLYDPLTMPADLLKAHQTLDRAVDRCYRPKRFESERERVEYLFALYEQLTAPLAAQPKPRRRKRTRARDT